MFILKINVYKFVYYFITGNKTTNINKHMTDRESNR